MNEYVSFMLGALAAEGMALYLTASPNVAALMGLTCAVWAGAQQVQRWLRKDRGNG